MDKVNDIIKILQLRAHPEGGYYRETYRSLGNIPGEALEGYGGRRSFSTSIYFMLTEGNFSAFHRLKQDEIWHFYFGGTILLHLLNPSGEYQRIELGHDLARGQVPQFVVEGGIWFASEVCPGETFGLAGCTVSPGFDFADFDMPPYEELVGRFPQHDQLIRRLTRG